MPYARKEDRAEYQRLYRERKKEELRDKSRERYLLNKEEHAARCRKYYQKNKDKIKAYQRELRNANVEAVREYDRRRYRDDPERTVSTKKRALEFQQRLWRDNREEARRQAREHQRHHIVARRIADEKWHLCDELCYICGKHLDFEGVSADHVHPVVHGGTDEWNNVMPTHRSCNSRKNDSLNYPVARPDLLLRKREAA